MDRRRFLGALAGSLAATAGCASNGSDGAAGPEPAPTAAAGPGTVHAGPALTARAPDPTTDPPSTTAVVVTSTESVTVTPTTSGDDGGSPGGGAGGEGTGAPSGPTTPTPTVASADPGSSSPLQLTLASVTMRRVVGELTCTAGPLAWMAVEVGFLRDGEPVASERRRRDEPGTGEALAFDVASEEPELDGVRLATAFAYPAP